MLYNDVVDFVLSTRAILLAGVSEIKAKTEIDFVTNIDISVNLFLKEKLGQNYPHIDFFSEEETSELSDNCWILDPIDGTTNLIRGYNMSSVSLAHCVDGEIQFGIVFNPFREEFFSAVRGEGAYYNRTKRLSCSNRDITMSIIEFGAGSSDKVHAENNFKIALEVFQKAMDIRRICSSALALCYIADARIDGYFERKLKPWDFAAASLILSEAGGKLTDFSGKKLSFERETSIIASNTVVHDSLKDIILSQRS